MRLLLLALSLLCCSCALTRTVSERDVSRALGRTVIVQYGTNDGWETRNSDTLYVYWVGAVATLASNAADRDAGETLDAIGIPRRFGYVPGRREP
jgi:hypothetical protein